MPLKKVTLTNDELARLRKYTAILELGNGELALLTPVERADLEDLLKKWTKENYG